MAEGSTEPAPPQSPVTKARRRGAQEVAHSLRVRGDRKEAERQPHAPSPASAVTTTPSGPRASRLRS